MSGLDIAVPAPRSIITDDDFAAIQRWADEQRAELQRLAEELHGVAGGAEQGPPPGIEPTPALFAPVDVMIESTMRQIDAETEAVRVAAARLVDDAVREATELLEAAGADPDTIRRVTARNAESPAGAVRRPRPAAELWQEIEARRPQPPAPDGRVEPEVGADRAAADAASVHSADPVAEGGSVVEAGAAAVVRGVVEPGPGGEEHVGDPAEVLDLDAGVVGEGAAFFAGAPGSDASRDVHEIFWGEAPPDRPVRERLRRLGQRTFR